MSIHADDLVSKRKRAKRRREKILLKLEKTEKEILQRNVELKKLIDDHTQSLLEELSLIKQNQIKDCENEKEEFEHIYYILKSFETYCTELRSKGSASDICSCVDELSLRADELEKEHDIFIGRPYKSTEVSFKATDFEEILNTSSNNVVGRIQETEKSSQFENCVLITGLSDGQNELKDVLKINLHRPNEISTEQQIPTIMPNGAAAVYFKTMYITGIGIDSGEIWKYNLASGWKKRASLVQSRESHSAAFVDKVLYICGGYDVYDKTVLDSVEGYNTITNTCTTVGKLVHCVQMSGNCVQYKSSLYIFGGADNDYSLDHVQMYDTKLNTCTLLSKPLPRPNSLLRAAPFVTSVILLGSDTCLIFNFESETWQERKQFKTDFYYFGLVLENERMFVIGGGTSHTDGAGNTTWTCRDDIRYVPLKCVIEDKPVEWENYAKLPKAVLVDSFGKIAISCKRPK